MKNFMFENPESTTRDTKHLQALNAVLSPVVVSFCKRVKEYLADPQKQKSLLRRTEIVPFKVISLKEHLTLLSRALTLHAHSGRDHGFSTDMANTILENMDSLREYGLLQPSSDLRDSLRKYVENPEHSNMVSAIEEWFRSLPEVDLMSHAPGKCDAAEEAREKWELSDFFTGPLSTLLSKEVESITIAYKQSSHNYTSGSLGSFYSEKEFRYNSVDHVLLAPCSNLLTSNLLFGNVSSHIIPIGSYGKSLSDRLLRTGQILSQILLDHADDSSQVDDNHSEILKMTARSSDGEAFVTSRILSEGVESFVSAMFLLTAAPVDGFSTPESLVEAVIKARLPGKLAKMMRGGILNPLVNRGGYLEGLVVRNAKGEVEIDSAWSRYLIQRRTKDVIKGKVRRLAGEIPASGLGCPLSYSLPDSPAGRLQTALDVLGETFLQVFEILPDRLPGALAIVEHLKQVIPSSPLEIGNNSIALFCELGLDHTALVLRELVIQGKLDAVVLTHESEDKRTAICPFLVKGEDGRTLDPESAVEQLLRSWNHLSQNNYATFNIKIGGNLPCVVDKKTGRIGRGRGYAVFVFGSKE